MNRSLLKMRYCLTISFALVFICGCGEPDVILDPGEKLTDVLDNFKNVKEQSQENSTRSEANAEDLTVHNLNAQEEEKFNSRVQNYFGTIRRELDDETSDYRAKIVTLSNDKKALFIQASHFEVKGLDERGLTVSGSSLTRFQLDRGENDSQIIIHSEDSIKEVLIVADTITINQGFELHTQGRDLTLIARHRLQLNGGITTTPLPASDNEKGQAAGRIRLAAVEIKADPKEALLDTSGGDAGRFNKSPSRTLSTKSTEATALLEKARDHFVENEPIEELRQPTVSDASLIFEGWEHIRPQITRGGEPWKYETALFQGFSEHHFKASTEERNSYVDGQRGNLIKGIRRAIESSLEDADKDAKPLLINDRLFVTIRTQKEEPLLKTRNNEIKIEVPGVKYQPLPGGAAGTVEIVTALSPPLLRTFQSEGTAAENQHGVVPRFDFGTPTLELPLITTVKTFVDFTLRKDWEDKSLLPLKSTRAIRVERRQKLLRVRPTVDPNNYTTRLSASKALRTPPADRSVTQSPKALVQTRKAWGLENVVLRDIESFQEAQTIFEEILESR